MIKPKFGRLAAIAALLTGGAIMTAIACGGEAATPEPIIIRETVVVQASPQIVEKTVIVQASPQIVEKTVIVAGTPQVVKETVVVKETSVVQQTVVVVQTATATPVPVAKGIEQVPAPNPKSPVGTAVLAASDDPLDQNGRNQAQSGEGIHYWGIGETMFLRGPNDEALGWLAESWTIDANYHVVLKIAKNVPFQKVPGKVNTSGDWGTLTAQDVAWSMNDANSVTNPQSIHGQAGDFNLFSEWKAVDANTVEFDFRKNAAGASLYDSTWKDDYLNQSGQAFVVFSKKAFDTEGADWVRDNVVATGPFQVESWTRSDKVTMVSRYTGTAKHWKPELTPKTQRIQRIYVPDSVTRVAMMKTGEADATSLPPKDVGQFVKEAGQFATASTGGTMQMGIFFAGNLWEKVSAVDGSPLVRGTYVHDLATIGNPDDAADMEEARLIRTALSMAYDRDAINKAILAGLGHPAIVEYVSIKNPRFQKDPSKGWQTADGKTNYANFKWNYPYDVKAAQALILSDKVQGNYQRGGAKDAGPLGKKSFEISLYSQQPDELRAEVQDAVAGYWTDLGLLVYTLKFSYQTFRPTVVGRTNVHPWVTECDKGNEGNPWHFPKGLVQTSLTRGGFGCGFEIPFVLENYKKVASAADTEAAAKLVDEYVAYMHEQALQPGIVSAPNLTVYNLKKVKTWEMAKSATSGQDSFWNLELQAGK